MAVGEVQNPFSRRNEVPKITHQNERPQKLAIRVKKSSTRNREKKKIGWGIKEVLGEGGAIHHRGGGELTEEIKHWKGSGYRQPFGGRKREIILEKNIRGRFPKGKRKGRGSIQKYPLKPRGVGEGEG